MEGCRGGGEQTHCSQGGERGIVSKTDSLCGRMGGWSGGGAKGQRKVKPGIFCIDAPILSLQLEVIHNPTLGYVHLLEEHG